MINKSYEIKNANIWERKIITLEGDAGAIISNLQSDQWWTVWHLGASPGYMTTQEPIWGTYDGSNWAGFHEQNGVITTQNATWQITGVQLEVGRNATEFEHRNTSEELALCQRYFQSNFPTGVAPQNAYYTTTSNLAAGFNGVVCFSSSNARSPWVMFHPKMRATPTVTLYSASTSDTAGKWAAYKGSWDSGSSNSIDYFGSNGFGVRYGSGGHSFVIGEAYLYRGMWAATAEM